MSKFTNKVNRNWAFKNLGLEFLSSLIDDDSEGDDVEVGSVDDDSEGDDVEVGSVDDEGINKMYEDFDDRETLLNRCKGLMELIKNKLKGFNGAFCLPPQDGVVEKDAPELVFNIMKTTGTDFVLGGAQPEIATLEVDEPKVKFKEHDSMVGALVNPKKPFAAIIGGSKMSSKIGLIEYLLAKLDMLILGGGTFFTFYKAMGYSVGSSLVEEDKLDLATSLLQKVKAYKILLLLPIDLVIADKYAADANSKIVTVSEDRPSIPDGWMGLDIGPDSVGRFSENLDSAETVIWNGPMGVVEFEKFAVGTKAIVTKLAKFSSRMGVRTFIGGGDSIAVVEKAGLVDRMIYKSTGGTVGLELLVELADKTC